MATSLRFSEQDLWVKPPKRRRSLVTLSRLIGFVVFSTAILLLTIGLLAA